MVSFHQGCVARNTAHHSLAPSSQFLSSCSLRLFTLTVRSRRRCCERRPATPADQRLGNDVVRREQGLGYCPGRRVIAAPRVTGDRQHEAVHNGGHPTTTSV